MANTDRARGFVPVRHLDGASYNGSHRAYLIPSTDNTAVFVGDLVKLAGSSGAAGVTVAGVDCEGMATVARDTSGTTGAATIGVVVGFAPDPTALGTNHRLASTNRIAYVCVDRSVVYEVQEDAATTPIAAASIGLNCAVVTTAGSATTGLSGMLLDSDSVETTVTLPVKIVGLSKRVDNRLNVDGAGADKAKFEVILNTGTYQMPSIGQ